MENKKKYGLFLSKKDLPNTKNEVTRKPAVFNEDSDSDNDTNVDWVKKSLTKEPYGGGARTRQSKSEIQKVLAEDPTAYQYDEVYDELQKSNSEALAAKKTDRQPKYIQLLLAQADRRKRENVRRLTRQIQKEREAEGDEFADKEVFVTSSYKKKLEEMKKMDEEDKHMEMLEDIGDVTKQRDMTGFYRHLYRQTVSKEDLRKPLPEQSSFIVKSEPNDDTKIVKPKSTRPRQFRKRKSSESSSGSETDAKRNIPTETGVADAIHPSEDANLDASENNESEMKKSVTQRNDPLPESINEDTKNDENKIRTEADENAKKTENGENNENVKETKPKVSIWIKRTIGDVFDATLERYYQRKAARLAAKGS